MACLRAKLLRVKKVKKILQIKDILVLVVHRQESKEECEHGSEGGLVHNRRDSYLPF